MIHQHAAAQIASQLDHPFQIDGQRAGKEFAIYLKVADPAPKRSSGLLHILRLGQDAETAKFAALLIMPAVAEISLVDHRVLLLLKDKG